jgi:transposase InsO family protein
MPIPVTPQAFTVSCASKGYYTNMKTRKPYVPKPYDTPKKLGQKWQLDVKHVPQECKTASLLPEHKFYQYTVIDEASRERFLFAYDDLCASNTVDFLKRAVMYFRYKPKIIQTDNGSEFTYTRETKADREHSLDKFCRVNHITHKLIKPRTPRHNGKVERSHRSDNERFYKWLRFYSLDDLQKQMKAYLERSNTIPMSVLYPRNGKRSDWLTPKQKRAELLLLDYNIVE